MNHLKGLVLGHLNRLKQYSQAALNQKQEGRAIIRVSINPLGEIISTTLLKSSGSSSLDNESLELFKRASPLPRPPKSLIKDRHHLSFVLPIDFNIKLYFSQKRNE
ncbi:energy transducer TonB [Helicobacter sp. 13S00477-4]|uniref:energy transducer TonB family protein n=1 Tax=Helicobacter sp. 13S00477-4 TaxID=1905759 RepID=UPI000BA5F6CF|nr:energy transducer TonB [Helicobacter sp. 13S00477-4]PAF52577.1 hypothetical protein BKH44_02030 [Helicobacter sp. 13S00477-4]